MIIHLIDGTYELFRHFYGLRSFNKGKDKPFGAVAGVLNEVLKMIEEGATHSFKNEEMPWERFRQFSEVELKALRAFLLSNPGEKL